VDPLEILLKAVENVKPRLEVKSRRVGGATYQVPMEVPPGRQLALAMRWIVGYAQARKNVPMMKALANELKEAAAGQGNAIKKRDDTHKMAQANRAFAHFRFWQLWRRGQWNKRRLRRKIQTRRIASFRWNERGTSESRRTSTPVKQRLPSAFSFTPGSCTQCVRCS